MAIQANKRTVGFLAGVLVFLTVYFIPIANLSYEGHTLLALLLMTVVFWALQVVQPGYAAGLFLALLVIFKVEAPEVIFSPWTGSTIWLVIGAYIIAGAVTSSGLGERIAYNYIIRFVRSYRSIVISIFVLTIILSLVIPHPWPRAFLILSVMKVVMKAADMPKEDRVKIGFTVFAAAVSCSTIFLTGDSSFNPLVIQFAGVPLGWLEWFKIMSVPGIAMSIMTCLLILLIFKPTQEVQIDKEEIRQKLQGMGRLTQMEIRTILWLVLAIVLWMTDFLHGINVGWVTLLIAMGMSFPIIGEIITPKAWSEVPVHVLVFLTAAMAIGKVGGTTGMNQWIFDTLLPERIPTNMFLMAALITLICICVHMVLGSCIAVMGVACPAMIVFTSGLGISPLVPAFIVYTAIYTHYIFPYQNLPILVGSGEENGGYSSKESVRMGIPLIGAVFITTVVVEVLWFKLIGLL